MGFLSIVMNSVNEVAQSFLGQGVAGASMDNLLTIAVIAVGGIYFLKKLGVEFSINKK